MICQFGRVRRLGGHMFLFKPGAAMILSAASVQRKWHSIVSAETTFERGFTSSLPAYLART